MAVYVPVPVDTSAVHLPEGINELVEMLAKNNHDVWAVQRMSQGWTWGPERNDALKHHPCLVAYEDLPDKEKEYDRLTALGALRLIVALGYKIVPAE